MTDDMERVLDGEEGSDSPEETDDKRVRDLMSKWQKAEARAAKAEERLASMSSPAVSGQDPWIGAAREAVLDALYASDPRYERYGIERSFFEGGDPTVVKAAAKELSALLDGVEAKARAEVGAAGYVPEIGGGSGKPTKVDFEAMNKDDFEALVAKAKSGRA